MQPTQAQAMAYPTRLTLATLLTLFAVTHTAGSSHAPYNLTWQIIDTNSGTVLNQTSQLHPKDMWFPELRVDLLDLIHVQYNTAFARNLNFCLPQALMDSTGLHPGYMWRNGGLLLCLLVVYLHQAHLVDSTGHIW